MARYCLSTFGVDRPGIVAAISEALAGVGANLEDSTMTILQGHFVVMLVIAVPDEVARDTLEAALAPVSARYELTVSLRPLPSPHDRADAVAHTADDVTGAPGTSWVVAVHGADRPGIVHAVTSALAGAGGNVVDLTTHLVGAPDDPVYVMTLRVTLPSGPEGDRAAAAVREAAESFGVHCAVHLDEPDVL